MRAEELPRHREEVEHPLLSLLRLMAARECEMADPPKLVARWTPLLQELVLLEAYSTLCGKLDQRGGYQETLSRVYPVPTRFG